MNLSHIAKYITKTDIMKLNKYAHKNKHVFISIKINIYFIENTCVCKILNPSIITYVLHNETISELCQIIFIEK